MKSIFRLLFASALPVALAACGSMGLPARSDVPAAIAVPSANRLAFTLHASGLLNYVCRARTGAAGGDDWVVGSPEAVLRDRGGAIVGRLAAGPTWEHGDGSKVTGEVLATTAAPKPGNLPWQLVQTRSTAGARVLDGVTYVQRIHTEGGTAPSDACTPATVGKTKPVRFAADYVFYKN